MCWTPKHYRIMMAAAGGLVLYVGGTWFVFIHTMRILRRTKGFGEELDGGLRQVVVSMRTCHSMASQHTWNTCAWTPG